MPNVSNAGIMFGQSAHNSDVASFMMEWYTGGAINHWVPGLDLHATVPTITVANDTWYHHAYVWNGSEQRAYVNGIHVQTRTGTAVNYTNTSTQLVIGSGYTTTYGPMNGKIDGIRITKAERYTGTSTTEWGNYSQPSAEWDYVGRTYTGTTTVLDKMGGGLVRFGDTSANNPLLKLETSGSTAAAASTIAKYDIADTTQNYGYNEFR